MAVLVPNTGHALADLAGALAAAATRAEAVAETAAQAAARMVGDVAAVGLVGADGRNRPPAIHPDDVGHADALVRVLAAAGDLAGSREPVVLAGSAGVLCPLLAGDARLGYLALARTAPDSGYSPADVDLVRDIAGEVALALATARSTELLRTWEERYRRIVETALEGVWQLDPDGVTTAVNEPMATLLGLPSDQVPGRSMRSFLAPGALADLPKWLAECGHGEQSVHKTRLVRADGAVRWVQVAAAPLPGQPGGALCMVSDVTEQEQARGLKRQLDHLRRLDSLGQLIGGIAHDFNNLLTVVAGSAEMIAGDAEPGSTRHQLATEIVEATTRGRRLAHQLLAFGRSGGRAETATVPDLLASVTHLLDRTLGEHIRLDINVAPDVKPVHAERGPLEQVLVNVAANARDAMPRGGVLAVTATNVILEPGQLDDLPAGGRFVRIALADTGSGMDAEQRERAFEPFFTTKPNAAGLGLATAASIIRSTGGQIRLDSVPRLGTTVELYLPCAETPVPVPAADPPVAALPGHILVVEDQPELAHLIRYLLQPAGYQVTVATDPQTALTCLPTDVHPDLLLSDVVMPGMTGPELAALLRERYPGLRVLYTSGYAPAVVGPQASIDVDNLLQKPFTRDTLLAAIQRAST